MTFWVKSILVGLTAALFAEISFAQSGIEVRKLGSVHPFEVDVGGELPKHVWSSGSSISLKAVLQTLPDSADVVWTHEPASRMALNTLLSGGPPPARMPEVMQMAALRADRALAVGRAEPVYELLSRTPEINKSAQLSQLFAEISFALGDLERACRTADGLLSERDTPYWLRARAACLAFDGNIPAAELTAELARTNSSDPDFDPILDAFTIAGNLPKSARPKTGLSLALAAELAPQTRIEAHEDAPTWLKRAANRTGPAITLPTSLPDALEAAVQMKGADRKAALGALIQQDFDLMIATEALATRLMDAVEDKEFLAVAETYGPEIAGLPVTIEALANGALFTYAALAAGDMNSATTWFDALKNGPHEPISPERDINGILTQGAAHQISPPEYANPVEEIAWVPAEPDFLAELDFARKVARGDIRTRAFAQHLSKRMETPSPSRVCQAAALIALGAYDQSDLRTAMIGTQKNTTQPIPNFGPVLLTAHAGAVGETQLLAAKLLNEFPNDTETCAITALALDKAGLRASALRFILEHILQEAL